MYLEEVEKLRAVLGELVAQPALFAVLARPNGALRVIRVFAFIVFKEVPGLADSTGCRRDVLLTLCNCIGHRVRHAPPNVV